MTKAKKTEWIASGVLFALFALFFLYLGKGATTPLIYPDEAGYIGWARLMAGKAGDPYHYSPGFSLLLFPVYLFTDSITTAYPIIVKINALIGACIPVLLYRISGVWCKKEAVLQRMAFASVASLYPAVTAYSQLALGENLLCVLLLGIALCICALWENRTKVELWIFMVILCLWATMTHARGITFAMAALITSAVIWRDQKKLLITGGIVGITAWAVACVWLLSDTSHVGAVHMLNQFKKLFTLSGMGAFFGTVASHFCAVLWSTYGLAAVALWCGIRSIWKKESGWGLWVFLLSSFLLLLALSAFYMSHHEKQIHILYGRYVDVALPFLLAGLFCNWSKEKKTPWLIGLIYLGVVLATGLLYGKNTAGLDGGIMNSVGIFMYRLMLRFFDFWWAAAFFALLTVLVFLCARRKRGLGIGAVCFLFLLQAITMKTTYFDKEDYGKRLVPQVTQQLPQGAEVFVSDGESSHTWQYYNYPIHRPDLVMDTVDRGQPYVLSRELMDQGTLIAIEKNTPVYLYSRLEEEKGAHYPQELEEYKVDYRYRQTEGGLEVTITNLGSTWFCFPAVRDVCHTVRLGVREFDEKGNLIADQRLDLSDNMVMGDQQTFSLRVSDRCEMAEIQPVVEFNAWFSDRGAKVLLLQKQKGEWVEMKDKEPWSDHSFGRVEFSHLRYANQIENTSYRGNLVDFYGNDTGAEATIQNIKMPGGTGVLLIESEDQRENVSVILNDTVTVSAEKYEEGAYHFPFEGIEAITSITIRTDTVNPFETSGLPKWMSFLSLDSNLKPVQFAVHRLEDILGKEVNNHEFGLGIDALEVRLSK